MSAIWVKHKSELLFKHMCGGQHLWGSEPVCAEQNKHSGTTKAQPGCWTLTGGSWGMQPKKYVWLQWDIDTSSQQDLGGERRLGREKIIIAGEVCHCESTWSSEATLPIQASAHQFLDSDWKWWRAEVVES